LTESVAVIHSAYEDKPCTVALIDMDKTMTVEEKLEKAFMLTNSIDDAWYTGDEVNYIGPEKHCRSTSVGDFVLIGTTKYECKPAFCSAAALSSAQRRSTTIVVDLPHDGEDWVE
jgi:hypothetical protein